MCYLLIKLIFNFNLGPRTFGEKPQQGKRNDLIAVKEDLDSGATLADISQDHFGTFCRYRNSFRDYLLLNSVKRSRMPRISVFWGPPGTGKSFRAFTIGESAGTMYSLSPPSSRNSTLWFDGYCNQEVLICDEFYGWIKYDFLLRLLDRYPFQVQCKGSSTNFNTDHIIFSSNKPPSSWYPKVPNIGALERRLGLVTSEVVYMGEQAREPGFIGPLWHISEADYLNQLASDVAAKELEARQREGDRDSGGVLPRWPDRG